MIDLLCAAVLIPIAVILWVVAFQFVMGRWS